MANTFICLKDFEDYANIALSKNVLNFFKTGIINNKVNDFNRKAFSLYKLRPRCLRNVANRDLSTTILGNTIQFPIGIGSIAFQELVHFQGECASAKENLKTLKSFAAAQALNTVFILSSEASNSIDKIAKEVSNGNNWLQIYLYKEREVIQKLVQKAEQANFKAIVVSVIPVLDKNLLTSAIFSKIDYFRSPINLNSQWSDLKWLRSITHLPIVVQGILNSEDAILAVNSGVNAILVSNLGNAISHSLPCPVIQTNFSKLNKLLKQIEILSEISNAVGQQVEIYLEGGIREGIDVYKALALGARMVFLNRPIIWGLAQNGEDGVKRILDILKSEFESTLAMTGCATIQAVTSNMVVHQSHYSKI